MSLENVLHDLLKKDPCRKKITFNKKLFSKDDIEVLAEKLLYFQHLSYFSLTNSNIGPYKATLLSDVLYLCRSITLSGNQIGDDGIIAFSIAFLHYNRIDYLDFSNNIIGPRGATAFADSLKHLPLIRYIILDDNHIQNQGAIALANNLAQCTRLKGLFLHNTNIGSDGIKAIAKAIPLCPKLTSFGLMCNPFQSDGATALADALPQCHSLRMLYLGQNDVGVNGIIDISKALAQCSYIQTIVWNEYIDPVLETITLFCCNLKYLTLFRGLRNEKLLENICSTNKERIKKTYEVEKLDLSLQIEDIYSKMYSSVNLTKAIEDEWVSAVQVHKLMSYFQIYKINMDQILKQCIGEASTKHAGDVRFLQELSENHYYGADKTEVLIPYYKLDEVKVRDIQTLLLGAEEAYLPPDNALQNE